MPVKGGIVQQRLFGRTDRAITQKGWGSSSACAKVGIGTHAVAVVSLIVVKKSGMGCVRDGQGGVIDEQRGVMNIYSYTQEYGPSNPSHDALSVRPFYDY
jgi:hypothetical protein